VGRYRDIAGQVEIYRDRAGQVGRYRNIAGQVGRYRGTAGQADRYRDTAGHLDRGSYIHSRSRWIGYRDRYSRRTQGDSRSDLQIQGHSSSGGKI
jgi:hypothetical protein